MYSNLPPHPAKKLFPVFMMHKIVVLLPIDVFCSCQLSHYVQMNSIRSLFKAEEAVAFRDGTCEGRSSACFIRFGGGPGGGPGASEGSRDRFKVRLRASQSESGSARSKFERSRLYFACARVSLSVSGLIRLSQSRSGNH